MATLILTRTIYFTYFLDKHKSERIIDRHVYTKIYWILALFCQIYASVLA